MAEEGVIDGSTNGEQDNLLKKQWAEIYVTLKDLGLSWEPAALAINRASGTLRNLNHNDAVPTPQMIRSLNLYIAFQKHIHNFFRTGAIGPVPNIQEENREYYTTQLVWAEVKKNEAYMRAFIEYQIDKDTKGDLELKQKILDGFEQAAVASFHFAPVFHKPAPSTKYPTSRGKKKKKDDTEQPTPPDEPTSDGSI